jgi:hypothetical protein
MSLNYFKVSLVIRSCTRNVSGDAVGHNILLTLLPISTAHAGYPGSISAVVRQMLIRNKCNGENGAESVT